MAKNLINKLLQHYYLTAFLAGWLAVAAMPPFNCFPILFICFPLLLQLINLADSPFRAFKIGYCFGFGFFAFGLTWILHALFLDIAAFWWLIPIAFVAAGLFFGLFIAIPAGICKLFQTPFSSYLALATLIVFFEWIRSFFLTGFPWNLFGTAFVFSNHLLQTASLGGVYLLSLAVILIAGAPFLWINKCRLTAFAVPCLLLVFMFGFGTYQINRHPYKPSATTVRMVQPAIPQTLKWNPAMLQENLLRHIEMSQADGLENTDFVVWSETAFPFALDFDSFHREMLLSAIPPHGKLITGALRYLPLGGNRYKTYNSMFILNPDGSTFAYYDKTHLVPFGEYIPLREYLPEWIKPVANTIGTFSTGTGPKVIKTGKHPAFGGLICYEVIFPHRILNPQNKPDWIINLTNDGWYGDSAGPWQHLTAARLRAVEEGITIVRVAGSGISALISPLGIVIKQIPLQTEGIADVKLPQKTQFSTIYGRFGNLIPLGICILLIAFGYYYSRRFRRL